MKISHICETCPIQGPFDRICINGNNNNITINITMDNAPPINLENALPIKVEETVEETKEINVDVAEKVDDIKPKAVVFLSVREQKERAKEFARINFGTKATNKKKSKTTPRLSAKIQKDLALEWAKEEFPHMFDKDGNFLPEFC